MSLPDVRLCKAIVGGLLESDLKPKMREKVQFAESLSIFKFIGV